MTTVYREQAPPFSPGARRRSPATLLLVLLWAGVAAVVALWWQNTGSVVGTAGRLMAAGRISGLLCGYSRAVLIGLMARVPLLGRRIGSDRVARRHARAGRYTTCLLVAHVVLIIAGYAVQARTSFRRPGRVAQALPGFHCEAHRLRFAHAHLHPPFSPTCPSACGPSWAWSNSPAAPVHP